MSAERVARPSCKMRRRDDYEPFDMIRVGDVIRFAGRLRTVRKISRTVDDKVLSVGFAKLKRSWTTSPLTIYGHADLRRQFGGIVARRKGRLCATETECQITRGVEEGLSGYEWRRRVTQRDTVGRVW